MRGRGLVAAVVAALVLLVVPLGLVPYVLDPLAADDRAEERPSLVAAGDVRAAAGLTCEGEVEPPTSLPLTGRLEAARLCAIGPRFRRWTAPEALSDELAGLASALARLEPVSGDYRCFAGGGHRYDLRLVVDGEPVSLETGPSCLEFRVGGTDYLGTQEPFDAFLTSLEAQRSRREPPAPTATTALDCNPGEPWQDYALSPLGDPADMVEAVSCWRPDTEGDLGPRRAAVPVPTEDLASLTTEMRTRSRDEPGFDDGSCDDGRGYWQDLLGRTPWGDVVVVRGVCRTFLVSSDATTETVAPEFWQPSPRAQRILDALRR